MVTGRSPLVCGRRGAGRELGPDNTITWDVRTHYTLTHYSKPHYNTRNTNQIDDDDDR